MGLLFSSFERRICYNFFVNRFKSLAGLRKLSHSLTHQPGGAELFRISTLIGCPLNEIIFTFRSTI